MTMQRAMAVFAYRSVYGYAVSSADGSLTAVPTIQWDTTELRPMVHLEDGTLTTTPGSKFGSHGNTTMDATLDRTGTRAFFANQGDGSFDVTAYAIDASTGALDHLPGSPVPDPPAYVALTVAASPVSDDVYFGTGDGLDHFRATSVGITRLDPAATSSTPGRLAVVASF